MFPRWSRTSRSRPSRITARICMDQSENTGNPGFVQVLLAVRGSREGPQASGAIGRSGSAPLTPRDPYGSMGAAMRQLALREHGVTNERHFRVVAVCCLARHPICRKGAKIGSDLTIDNVVSTPAGQAAAMRNQGRYMATRARRQSTTPTPILPPRPDRYAATARSDTGPPVEGSCDG
jgi:hypothetical protein